MAKRNSTYEPRPKLSIEEKLKPVLDRIYEYASLGVSDETIAMEGLGKTLDVFLNMRDNYERNGEKPLLLAYKAGRAKWEFERAQKLDELAFEDPESSRGLIAKILRDDLRRLEHHAPATRAVRVQVEDTRTILDFDALSEEEQQAIVGKNSEGEQDEE